MTPFLPVDQPYVPSGPPPTASQFAAHCRAAEWELLWLRHDRRGRRKASQLVAETWQTMIYMAGRRAVPKLELSPEQLLKLRPSEAAGHAIAALAVAAQWAEQRAAK